MREYEWNPKLIMVVRVLAVIATMALIVWVFHHFAIQATP
jgi:phage shock protein PspC (stress-responsive transcriptional regulator)